MICSWSYWKLDNSRFLLELNTVTSTVFLFTIRQVSLSFHNSPTGGGVVELKTGRREVLGSTPGRACRPSDSEFYMVFLRNSGKYGLGFLRKTPTEDMPFIGPGPTSGQLTLKLQPNPTLSQLLPWSLLTGYWSSDGNKLSIWLKRNFIFFYIWAI